MPSVHIKSVHFSPHFFKSFQRLPRSIQAQAKKKDEWFRQNPFDPRLRTHKLKGELSGAWAYSIFISKDKKKEHFLTLRTLSARLAKLEAGLILPE